MPIIIVVNLKQTEAPMDQFSTTLKRFLLLFAALLMLCTLALAADHTAATKEELFGIIYDNLKAQDTYFTVDYTGPEEILYHDPGDTVLSCAAIVRNMAASLPNPDGTGGDLYMMNINKASCTKVDTQLFFAFEYLLDPQQLAWVDAQANGILSSLQLDNATDYIKIKKIYQYMGTNFTYDQTLTKFTDYEGLTTGSMVCQGYALLTYKLLWKAGVPCRIVVGYSNGQNHGWNIVLLDGKWYNLDTTWDAANDGAMYWAYFLKSQADFYGHTRDARFDSEAFHAQYPMGEESYNVPSIDILIDGVLYSGLTIRNGRSLLLEAVLNPEQDLPVTWSTSDETVVSITPSGTIESLTPGSVYITATVDDPNYIPGVFPITAVDLRTCSEWADAELNSYYLRKLYPPTLCSNYQAPILREEFAELLYQLLGSYAAKLGSYKFPGFRDVEQSPFWFAIVYTTSRGIFQGTGAETFSPEMQLTREQAAKVLCTALDFMGIAFESGNAKTFLDADTISPWAKEFVDRASAADLLLGDGETFRPQDPVTREEAAVMLERIFVNYIEPTLQTEETPAA